MAEAPETVVCTYRVRAGEEAAFLALLEKHWPALHELGLVTEEPSIAYRGEQDGGPFFVEIFTWRDGQAPRRAHELPGVMAVWGPMGELCEERAGKPAMEFPHVRRVELPFER